jgi:hypothetical protein
MWQKRIGPDWIASLTLLTSDQRWAVQQLARRMERDPSDQAMRPMFLTGSLREIETAGVWVRYELREATREILFLRASRV